MSAGSIRVIALAAIFMPVVALCGACDREGDAPESASSPVAAASHAEEIPLAPGYSPLAFDPPEPGTYRLPPLDDAADGQVLAMDGSPLALHDLMGDKIVVLSLMYASCSDVNGCPLATAVLHQVAQRMEKDPELAQGLRLVSLSFDPVRDTPEMMRKHAGHHAGHGIDWRFLTTASPATLQPILDGYGQSLVPEVDENGVEVGDISHILRVFLIDRDRRVRNIYSVSYLHADTLVADVKTLLLESDETVATTTSPDDRSGRGGPGDSRRGYERPDFESDSRALSAPRRGRVDLVRRAKAGQLGLPPLAVPADNPLTSEKVELGRRLFYDRRLSLNGTLSCAMCHVPDQGFTNNELATAVGIEGRTVRRNSPTILNVAHAALLFHDGRESRLEQQVWGPLLARNEMGNPSVGTLLDRIRETDDYAAAFDVAFPDRGLEIETLGMAIASYERTLESGGSPFDRWYYGKDPSALGEDAIAGYRLFTGKAGCVGCHLIGEDAALFMDDQLHDTGIGYAASMADDSDRRDVQLAPGEFRSVDADVIAQVSEAIPGDLGRYEISQDPADRWKYKTPSLRNVALTAPYMHDGSLSTLQDVVEFYDRGGVPNETLDPRIRPLDLSPVEIGQLVAFLESLTGSDVDVLADDGFAAQARRQTRLSMDPNIFESSTRSGVMRTGR
jgi:cytochrome c peroxidase